MRPAACMHFCVNSAACMHFRVNRCKCMRFLGLHFYSPPHDGRAGLVIGQRLPGKGQASTAKQQTAAVRPERHLQQALLACIGWAVLGSASDRGS